MDSTLGRHEGNSHGSYRNGTGVTKIENITPRGRAREQEECLLILDSRALDRECLAQSLNSHNLGMDISALGSIDEWRREKELHPPLKAILLNLGGRKVTDSTVANEITRLTSEFKTVPVVVLADTDDLTQILKALEYGARGYIPTSVGMDVCVEAMAWPSPAASSCQQAAFWRCAT